MCTPAPLFFSLAELLSLCVFSCYALGQVMTASLLFFQKIALKLKVALKIPISGLLLARFGLAFSVFTIHLSKLALVTTIGSVHREMAIEVGRMWVQCAEYWQNWQTSWLGSCGSGIASGS